MWEPLVICCIAHSKWLWETFAVCKLMKTFKSPEPPFSISHRVALDGCVHIEHFQTVIIPLHILIWKLWHAIMWETLPHITSTHKDTHTLSLTVQIRCLACVSRLTISGLGALDFGRQPSDRTLHHGGLWKVHSPLHPPLIAPVCLEGVMLCDSLAESHGFVSSDQLEPVWWCIRF